MPDVSVHRLSITGLRAAYASDDTTPTAVIETLLARIDAHDGTVGAFLDVHRDNALCEAKRMTDDGSFRTLPLGGVPVAVKDNIVVEGHPTSCASRILDGYVSPYTATVVNRLRDAGAIVIGKTNLDEFAMGSSTENSAMQLTRNPWNFDRAPGGSSGGSCAAVAADMAPLALGSDTGGSIRQPAGFCGVVGMKPTYGRVSRYGLVAFASSLDQIGPLVREVRDLAAVLPVVCGRDVRDATSLDAPAPQGIDVGGSAAGLRIGVPWAFLDDALDDGVRANFEKIVNALQDGGATIQDIDLPHARYAVATYYIIANAEASANLARFDGVRYALRTAGAPDLLRMYTQTRDAGFGDEVKRRILLGTYVLSSGYYDAYYEKAQRVRSLMIQDFETVFKTCDTVMLPTSPTPAFGIGEKTDDPVTMYLSDIFTIPVNMAGLPAVSVPSGLSPDRLPYGIQMIGRAMDEAAVVRGAAAIEAVAGMEGHPIA